MGFDASLCKYGFFWALEEILPKIHDSVDLVQVANKIKSCDVKKFVLNSL